MDPDRDRPRSKGRQMQNKRRFASPLVRHLARRDHGVSMGSVLHGMTPANRAKLRGEADRNGGKKEGSELAQGEQGKGGEGEKGDEEGREASARWWPREERRDEKEEKREWCACLGAKSWASRAQAWPRLTLERSRSEVIIEHEPPWGSQPPLGVADADIKLPH